MLADTLHLLSQLSMTMQIILHHSSNLGFQSYMERWEVVMILSKFPLLQMKVVQCTTLLSEQEHRLPLLVT